MQLNSCPNSGHKNRDVGGVGQRMRR